MGGYKYRVFLRKRPGLQNGVRLQGVSAYKGCPLGGVRLYQEKRIVPIYNLFTSDLFTSYRLCSKIVNNKLKQE